MFFSTVLFVLAAVMMLVVWRRQRLARANSQQAQTMLEHRQPLATVAREQLPEVMQRYLEHVLIDTTPITALHAQQRGTFDLNDTWQPFRASHIVTVNPPQFRWTASIRAGIGVDAQVVDRYQQRIGGLEAHLLGAFAITTVQDTTAINTGELMRYFAEMPWYPTGFLDEHVRWHGEANDHQATATLSDGDVDATITFFVNDNNEIERIEGQRYKGTEDDAKVEQWRGRFWDYQLIDGVRVPTQGEVMWVEDGHEQPYWRGHIESITFYRDIP
jgi:hypothetical protein